MSSSRPQSASFTSCEESGWAVPHPRDRETVLHTLETRGQAARILIVDRDSMSSDLLATALTRDGDFSASGIEAADLLNCLADGKADAVVIGSDLNVGSTNGFDLAQIVRRAHPSIPIVILLSEPTQESVLSAFRSGARGVFSRQRPVAEFASCVEHVCKGFIWAGAQETTLLLHAFNSIPSPELAITGEALPLTVRELQVVKCAARGKTNKAIAKQLGLSEHTVKNYLFRSFEKLGVSNRVELLFTLTQRCQTLSRAMVELPAPDPRAD